MKRYAFVRPPGESFAAAISSSGATIDVALARQQHEAYRAALRAAGVEVIELPPSEDFPDSCFMQDPALVVGGRAVVARPGATSRQGEEQLIEPLLAERFRSVAKIRAPGTLEGGDVLVLPGRVYVGRSDRTNAHGVAQLRAALAPVPVEEIPVVGLLHLLTGVTYLGRNTLLAVKSMADRPEFAGMDVLIAPDEEAYACNALGLGEFVVAPAGFGQTTSVLEKHGFRVLPVPVSEFAKADGGVTCLSLVWEETGTGAQAEAA